MTHALRHLLLHRTPPRPQARRPARQASPLRCGMEAGGSIRTHPPSQGNRQKN